MAESCTSFISNLCRDCNKTSEDHLDVGLVNEIQNFNNQSSTSHQVTNDNSKDDQNHAMEQDLASPVQIVSETILPPCRYGLTCYRTKPDHFEQYSHPPGHKRREYISSPTPPAVISTIVDDGTTSSTQDYASDNTSSFITAPRRKTTSRKKLTQQKNEELQFVEQIESRVQELLAELQSKQREINKLHQERLDWINSHQHLEKVLTDEVELNERREFERKHTLAIPQQTPSYWGPNVFSESYREIEISNESPEFNVINDLMNSTISTHNSLYGTVYGKDPTEFLVTQVRRIQNLKLWNEYCFKKDSIIRKNNYRLPYSGGSIHLENHPLLMPLLDNQSNEYWLFHGCSHDTVHHLLHSGYDPRVSSLKGMFGGGFYLAENSSKSNQYIPCRECNENAIFSTHGCNCSNQENFVFSMILYRVILGDVHVALQYDKKKYRDGTGKGKCVRHPPMKTGCEELYDSVIGESIKNGGDQLQHREFILYERGQAYPEYLINFRRSAFNARPPTDIERIKDRCRYFLKNTFRSVPE